MSSEGEVINPMPPSPTFSSAFVEWKSSCLEKPDAAKKEKLRSEAKSYFNTLVKSTEVSLEGKVIQSKSSHNEALTQLIADLGPAFATHHSSRICALYLLCGAIEGCGRSGLSLKITDLLGKFLVGHCGPIQPDIDDPDEDSDELVRDAAVQCLSALIRAHMDREDERDKTNILESIRLRLDLARNGVEKRCAASDSDDMEYDLGYDNSMPANDIRGSLSTLPRSRRALCFDLVRAGVDGVSICFASNGSSDLDLDSRQLRTNLASFASFAATCLHGESDPRCLLQLLRLLYELQRTFLRCFQKSESLEALPQFPTLDIFDAVAPYYPIQFTPPPNDVHGITRDGLHNALMAVLCSLDIDQTSSSNGSKDVRESMLDLSTGLFLERLVPPDSGDGIMNSTPVDKLEAIEDLSNILFPRDNPSCCEQLHQDTVKVLSSSLILTHEEASSSAAEKKTNKTLADACRTLVSRVALELERISQDKEVSLWDIFVKDPVKEQSPKLSASPQSMRGRSAVAYVSCLAASGGKRTLTVCLDSCLQPLVDALTSNLNDEEKVAAAAYGVGALFSSCRVALERGEDGVALHPHPLEAYSSKVLNELWGIIGEQTEGEEGSGQNVKLPCFATKIAAIRSMESVLSATPSSLLGPDDSTLICNLIELLTETVIRSTKVSAENDSPVGSADTDFGLACSRTLGSFLGISLSESESNDENGSVLLCNDAIQDYISDIAYPRLVTSALSESKSVQDTTCRHDWLTLAIGCKMSSRVSRLVIGELFKTLLNVLTHEYSGDAWHHPAVTPAMTLSYVLRLGGTHAVNAFHERASPDATVMDIIDALSSSPTDGQDGKNQGAEFNRRDKIQTSVGVSMLALPPTSEDRAVAEKAIQLAYVIVPYLLPAYQKAVPYSSMLMLTDHASQVLPPLSENDNVKLYVMLPLLSEALIANSLSTRDQSLASSSESLNKTLRSMVAPLAEYALNAEYDARARSAAASCLHSVITNYQLEKSEQCLSHVVMKDIVVPAVVKAVTDVGKSSMPVAADVVSSFKDSLSLTALLGSAAACRGKASSKIADEIAQFLIQLTCTGEINLPVNVNMAKLDGGQECRDWMTWPAPLFLAAASAFGSMLAVENGGPFWRQRLSHLALQSVLQAFAGAMGRSPTDPVAPPLGPLVIACHIVCSGSTVAIGKSNVEELVSIILWGLTACAQRHFHQDGVSVLTDTELCSTITLVLAATIKLMSVDPEMMSRYVTVIVPDLLLLYAEEGCNGGSGRVSLKLLVLQALLDFTYLSAVRRTLMQFKPAVVSVLSEGLDDRSALMRQAAVDVCNAWCILTA